MTNNDSAWLKKPRKLIRQGKKYLARKGYNDHDIEELAKAWPVTHPAPSISGRNALLDIHDPRPLSEIVATAKMIQLAKLVIEAWEFGQHDLAIEFLYYLGRQEAIAKTFVIFPGVSADVALDHDGFLRIAASAEKLMSKKIKNDLNLQQSRNVKKAKHAESKSARNLLICQKARELMNRKRSPFGPRDITSAIIEQWERYFPGEPLSKPTVRKILRNGKIIS